MINTKIAIMYIGQAVAGLAQPFFLNAPTKIANDMIPAEGSRAISIALMTAGNPLGGALSFLVIPAVVGVPADLDGLNLAIAVAASLCACVCVVFWLDPMLWLPQSTVDNNARKTRGTTDNDQVVSLPTGPPLPLKMNRQSVIRCITTAHFLYLLFPFIVGVG